MEITAVFNAMAHILGIVILGYLTLLVTGVCITTVLAFIKNTKEKLNESKD